MILSKSEPDPPTTLDRAMRYPESDRGRLAAAPTCPLCGPALCGGAVMLVLLGGTLVLLEKAKNRLRALIRLGEDRGAGRLQDLQLREVDHLRRHVDVLDLALRRAEVLLVVRQVVQRVLEAVLHGTEGGARRRDVV